jgi:O-antigen/teichoic acid export membrane protein
LFSDFCAFLGRRHTVRAHFWQTLANYTQSAGGMLLGIVLARLLEPAVFGKFVAINATLMFLMIPASFSTAQLLVSDAGKSPDLFAKVLGMALTVSFLKFLLLLGFIVFSILAGQHEAVAVGSIVGIPMILADWINALKSDLEGRGFFKPNFLVQIADLCAHAVVSITLVWHGWGLLGLAIGGLAGFIPQALLYVLLSDRRLAMPRFGFREFHQQFQSGFWLWLGSVASSWYSRIDKILLGHFGGTAQLGYYNRAMNYGPISHILLNSLMTNATVRGLSIKESNQEKRILFFKTAIIVISASLLNGAFWYFTAPTLVPLIFGSQWAGAIPAFQILGWLGVPYFLVYGTSTILYADKKFKAIALVHATGITIFCATILIAGFNNLLDLHFASWAFVACMLATGALMSYFSIPILFKGVKPIVS